MSEDVKRLVFGILRFINDQCTAEGLNEDTYESLEVAKQCLESAYGVSITDAAQSTQYGVDRSLLEVFNEAAGPVKPAAASSSSSVPDNEPNSQDKQQADSFKAQGNEVMKQEKFDEAVKYYSKAIELDGQNAVYYCNRAAAYSKMESHKEALDDCEHALEIDPQYSKAYGRKGLAHTALNQHIEARQCYQKALMLDPTNLSYQNNLEIAEQKLRESNVGGAGGAPGGPAGFNMGGMDFTSLLSNPALMNMATTMMSDPNMQQMMSGLMTGAAGNTEGQQGIGNLLQAGQRLAQQMQQSNPDLVDQLRTMNQDEPPPNEDGEPGEGNP